MRFAAFLVIVCAAWATNLASAASLPTYCPSTSDLVVTWGTPTVVNQGWNIIGGGGVATKAAFNLLGGYVQFDLDFTNVGVGVNANLYTISPAGITSSGYAPALYCDGQKTGSAWCPEVDIIESNGNCGAQTTLHTTQGPGANNCTAWGCANAYQFNGKTAFTMRTEFAADGTWSSTHNGVLIAPSNLSPVPHTYDWALLSQWFTTTGAVLTSTQWVGWVPLTTPCGGSSGGNLTGANFWVKNLVVSGTVVQGPTPTVCSGSATTTTTAAPSGQTTGGPAGSSTAKPSPAAPAALPNILVLAVLDLVAVLFFVF